MAPQKKSTKKTATASKGTNARPTRIPFATFLSSVANNAGMTVVDTQKFYDAMIKSMVDGFSRAGLQEVELPGFGVIQERRRTGQLAPELGGASYDVSVISFRASSVFKDAIQRKSSTRLTDNFDDDNFDDEDE